MFDLIARPFGYVMRFCASLCFNNYALALLLFTIIVKLVLLPFGIKQQKSQIKMARLRPKIAAIEKKYAGRKDRPTMQKKQQEIMELQQREGVSAFGGCLPLLIQFPILIGLFNVIRNPFTYLMGVSDSTIGRMMARAGLTGTNATQINLISEIQGANGDTITAGLIDKGEIPSFDLFGLDISLTPIDVWGWLILIPILSGVFSYFTMRLSRRFSGQAVAMGTGDAQKSNVIMDLLMPLISVYFSFTYTAALGIYWIYQSVFGLVQTIVLAKVMPLPKFSEEDLRRAEKEMKVEEARKKPVKIRSLHHIDDDDEDAAVALASGVSSRYGDEDEAPAAPAETKNTRIEGAPLKDDFKQAKKKNK